LGNRLGDRLAEIAHVHGVGRADVQFVVADAERDVRRIDLDRARCGGARRAAGSLSEVIPVRERVRVEHGDGYAVDAPNREVLAGRLEFGLELVAELLETWAARSPFRGRSDSSPSPNSRSITSSRLSL